MADCHTEINPEQLRWFLQVRSLLESGGIVEFTPAGRSMWPAIRPGRDTVFLARADSYGRTDIVLAISHNPEGVFLHRVVEVREDGYVLMGDSNLFQREICSRQQVIGKIVSIVRDGREVANSAGSRVLGRICVLPPAVRRFFVRMIKLFNRES